MIDTDMSTVEFYLENGFAILHNAIDSEAIENYIRMCDEKTWNKHDAYLEHPEILDILCSGKIQDFFYSAGMGVALHATRTLEQSSKMPWHHDSVLENEVAGDNYIGVWVALEDIDESSGPLELIAKSHKWDLDFGKLYKRDSEWSGDYNSYELLVEEIKKRNEPIFKFLAKKGDILIWHGRLVHRGAEPINERLTRKSLIGHYCNMYSNEGSKSYPSVEKLTQELEETVDIFSRWKNGGYYFK